MPVPLDEADLVRKAKSAGKRATDMTVPSKLSWQDVVALLLLFLLLPYMLTMYLGIAVVLLPLRLPTLIFCACTSKVKEAAFVPPTCAFYVVTSIETLLLFPLVAIAVIHFTLVQVVVFVVCAPIGLATGVNPIRNYKIISECTTMGGSTDCGCPLSPGGMYQFWRSVLGLYHRQQPWEWLLAPGWMIIFNPVLKYLLTTNIWLQPLQVKYCNQWTDPFQPNTPAARPAITALIKSIVSNYVVEGSLRDEIDAACFSGHYAAPPPGFQPKCLGMQFAPRKLSTNLTMTTHQYLIDGAKPKSATAKDALWAVELHYWNAWHFLTGYVEVSLQAEADGNALEHPMWIVVPETGRLGHKLYLGVNKLFADYSPQLHATITKRMK